MVKFCNRATDKGLQAGSATDATGKFIPEMENTQ
jgi:hypothetical protein